MKVIRLIGSVFYFLLCINLVGQNSLKEDKLDIESFNTTKIDIYQGKTGDFLDVDLDSYRKKANGAYKSGNYEQAARYYLMILRYDIHDANLIYNLACCYGLLGRDVLAAVYLKRAVKAGFNDVNKIRSDSDYEKVRGHKVFDNAVDSLISDIENKKKEQGEIIYIDNSALFRYRIHLPEDYDTDNGYPLLIGLHGGGGSCEEFITLWKYFEQPEFIYAAPQAPYAWLSGKKIGYDWALWPTGDTILMERAKEKLNEYIINVVDDLKRRYPVSEIYLMGHSQGSIFTYTTGIINHNLFKGLVVLSGVGIHESIPSPASGMVDIKWPSEKSFKTARKLRIFVAHSREDKVLNYELGTSSRDVLLKYGYDVTFCDFSGSHAVSPEVLKKVEKWLKK